MKKYIKNITKGMGIVLNKDTIGSILTILLSSINIYNGDVYEIIDIFALCIIPEISKSLKRRRRYRRLQKRGGKNFSFSSSLSSQQLKREKQQIFRRQSGESIKQKIFQDEKTVKELCRILNCDHAKFHEFLYKFFKKSVKCVARLAKAYLKKYHEINCSFEDDYIYILFEHIYRKDCIK